jgi:hypothetical protein
MEIGLLVIDNLDSHAPIGTLSLNPPTNPLPTNNRLVQCTVGGYPTIDPQIRNERANLICSPLGSNTIAEANPRSLEEFETLVSNWVRRCAAAQLSPGMLKSPKRQHKKKGTQQAALHDLLKSFLFKHHRFATNDLNLEPASMEQMATAIGKSTSTVTRYIRKLKFDSYDNYKQICGNYEGLKSRLELLDGQLPDVFRTNKGQSIEYSGDA